MRSPETLEDELDWYSEWPESDDIDVECTTSFNSDGFMEGIRYALGEDVGERDVPPVDALNTVVERVRDEYPLSEIHIERHGFPPTQVWLTVRVAVEFDTVDEYESTKHTVNEIARVVADEYGLDHISTSVDQIRD